MVVLCEGTLRFLSRMDREVVVVVGMLMMMAVDWRSSLMLRDSYATITAGQKFWRSVMLGARIGVLEGGGGRAFHRNMTGVICQMGSRMVGVM